MWVPFHGRGPNKDRVGVFVKYCIAHTSRMIDLSHTSHAAQRQAISVSEAPVIFSHSSWYVPSPPCTHYLPPMPASHIPVAKPPRLLPL